MKIVKVSVLSMLGILLTVVITVKINDYYEPDYPYVKEYIAGVGNIKGNVSSFGVEELEIGANKYGYAVFKNPRLAWKYLTKHYQKGIKLIQKEFNLARLSQANYEEYSVGWQVTGGTEEERSEAQFVASFMDIYENSYKIK